MAENTMQWKLAWLRACFYSVIAVSSIDLVVQRLLFLPGK